MTDKERERDTDEEEPRRAKIPNRPRPIDKERDLWFLLAGAALASKKVREECKFENSCEEILVIC